MILTNEFAKQLSIFAKQRTEAAGQKVFTKRGEPTKQFLDRQTEIMMGAAKVIDLINGDPSATCVTPLVVFSIIRGEDIEAVVNNLESKKA